MMKFLALTLYLLARITLILILSSAIIGRFQNLTFQRFNNLDNVDLITELFKK